MFGVSPLSPAYGRDYKSKKEVFEAFDSNKDFLTPFGQYTTKAELAKDKSYESNVIQIRYDKLRKTVIAKVR